LKYVGPPESPSMKQAPGEVDGVKLSAAPYLAYSAVGGLPWLQSVDSSTKTWGEKPLGVLRAVMGAGP
jgi:hypothetical protein